MALAASRIQSKKTTHTQTRERIVLLVFSLGILGVLARLFYWQILSGDRLTAAATDQYERQFTTTGSRGSILTADGHVLVGNQRVYRLFAQPQELTEKPEILAAVLAPLVAQDLADAQLASPGATPTPDIEATKSMLLEKLSNPTAKWVSLISNISQSTRDAIAELKLHGIGFDQYERRMYPEASMAAHLTGFVGKDEDGNDIGYFGIEGALEQELKARSQKNTIMADALGLPLPGDAQPEHRILNGRDIMLTVRRDIQNIAEKQLRYGLERYGATAGEVVILDPKTGDILALAAAPSYEQRYFYRYPAQSYPNPSLNALYEPGSTFKVLTVAAGIDAGVITPDTPCDTCGGPRTFGKYTIRTWNDSYQKDITITEALAKSDNTAMIFTAEKLGADTLRSYLEKFGIGEALHVELQGDRSTPFPEKWGPVELATISFGQGISTTTLQLTRAIASIANDGILMRPRIISQVTDGTTGTTITPPSIEERRVISPETARIVTEMMIESAGHGEAQWTASRSHWVAGKTGTSQIANAGGYEEDTTLASFVGFAPPDNPKFVMVVKLLAPTSSQWASETAAPLWYRIADELFVLLNIPPDRTADDLRETTPTNPAVGD